MRDIPRRTGIERGDSEILRTRGGPGSNATLWAMSAGRFSSALASVLDAVDRGQTITQDWLVANFPADADAIAESLQLVAVLETELQPNAIDGYRLRDELGRGGMGVVYETEREGRPLALKLMQGEWVRSEQARRRFLHEAELGTQVRHPNLVHTISFGDDGDRPYLVMERVEGVTLVEHGSLSVDESERVAHGVASALTAIHDAGVVHRDVKPSNVMLTLDGTVKLMDLGVASEGLEGRHEPFVGSLAYAAPEQVVGGVVDGRADIYALGLVLTELGDPDWRPELREAMLAPNPQDRLGARDVLDSLRTGVVRRRAADRIFGRDDELRSILDYVSSLRSGNGSSLLIEAVGGMGKSFLLDHALADASACRGRYRDGEAGIWSAWAEALHTHESALRERHGRLAALLFESSSDATPLPLARLMLFDALTDLAAAAPLMIVIEDLHHAPAQGAELCAAMADNLRAHSVLLIATTRPGVPRTESWSALLELPGLTNAALQRLVHACFEPERVSNDVARAIATRAAGVPYFVASSCRQLQASGAIARIAPGLWGATGAALDPPRDLRDAIRQQLEHLPPAERDLLQLLALSVEPLCPELNSDAAVATALAGRGLIRSRDGALTFDHDVVREVVRDSIATKEARQCHRLLASHARTSAAQVHHFAWAGEDEKARDLILAEIARARTELDMDRYIALHKLGLESRVWHGAERASALVEYAKNGASRSFGHERAAALLEEARDLAHRVGDEDTRMRAMKDLVIALALTGRSAEAILSGEQSLELANRLEDVDAIWEIKHYLATAFTRFGLRERAAVLARQLLEDLPRDAHPDQSGAAHHCLGTVYFYQGRLREALYEHATCYKIGRHGNSLSTATLGLGHVGTVLVQAGFHKRALHCFEVARARVRDAIPVFDVIMAGKMASLYSALGDPGKHIRFAENALAESIRLAQAEAQFDLHVTLAGAYAAVGARAKARAMVERGRVLAAIESTNKWVLTEAAIEQSCGDLEREKTLTEQALQEFRRIRDPLETLRTLRMLAVIECERREYEKARSRFAEVDAMEPFDDPRVAARTTLARTYLPDGDTGAARAAFQSMEPRLDHFERMRFRYRFWIRDGDARDLDAARTLLHAARDTVSSEYKDSMLRNVVVHDAIERGIRP